MSSPPTIKKPALPPLTVSGAEAYLNAIAQAMWTGELSPVTAVQLIAALNAAVYAATGSHSPLTPTQ